MICFHIQYVYTSLVIFPLEGGGTVMELAVNEEIMPAHKRKVTHSEAQYFTIYYYSYKSYI